MVLKPCFKMVYYTRVLLFQRKSQLDNCPKCTRIQFVSFYDFREYFSACSQVWHFTYLFDFFTVYQTFMYWIYLLLMGVQNLKYCYVNETNLKNNKLAKCKKNIVEHVTINKFKSNILLPILNVKYKNCYVW